MAKGRPGEPARRAMIGVRVDEAELAMIEELKARVPWALKTNTDVCRLALRYLLMALRREGELIPTSEAVLQDVAQEFR